MVHLKNDTQRIKNDTTFMRIFSFIIYILLTTTTFSSFGNVSDSLQLTTIKNDSLKTNQTENYHEEIEDDFSPGLLIFALFGLGLILLSVGAGIVLTVFGILILFGLIGAGILSASILVGLHNRSFGKGFKTFLISGTTVGGLFIGATGFWLLNKVVHWFTTSKALIIGAIGGLLTGMLLGIFLFYVIRKLTAFLKDKLK